MREKTLPHKSPIDPKRVRTIPSSGFSWIDRRWVQQGWIERFPPETKLLYFFLVSVSDAQGLSFYADSTIVRLLGITHEELSQARARLGDAELILYRDPLYQVLPLPEQTRPIPPRPQPPEATRGGEPISLREFLALAIGDAPVPSKPQAQPRKPGIPVERGSRRFGGTPQ